MEEEEATELSELSDMDPEDFERERGETIVERVTGERPSLLRRQREGLVERAEELLD